jgi:hypothetical protein
MEARCAVPIKQSLEDAIGEGRMHPEREKGGKKKEEAEKGHK